MIVRMVINGHMVIMMINDGHDKNDDHDSNHDFGDLHDAHDDDDDFGDLHDEHGDDFSIQTLGAGSVEEHLDFKARYEFVSKLTKVNIKKITKSPR